MGAYTCCTLFLSSLYSISLLVTKFKIFLFFLCLYVQVICMSLYQALNAFQPILFPGGLVIWVMGCGTSSLRRCTARLTTDSLLLRRQ